MNTISKQDLIDAFQNDKRKRNNLLFEYYKDTLFNKGLSAEFIADKISQDLGIKISRSIIYKINHRIIKNIGQSPAWPAVGAQGSQQSGELKQNQQGKKGAEPGQSSKVWESRNADEYPQLDPFGGAFDDL